MRVGVPGLSRCWRTMPFMAERTSMIYEFEISGGGFDGAPGLKWLDDGVNPPPERILVGRCERDADCGAESCRVGVAHISFWTLDEEDIPLSAQVYARERVDDERGRAVYVIGGLLGESALVGVMCEIVAARAPVSLMAAGSLHGPRAS